MSADTAPRRAQLAKHTDLGNAQRMAARYAEVIRYVQATGTWHIWDGARWAPDATGQIERLARDTVRAIQREADGMSYADEDAKLRAVKWGVACESAAKLAAMVHLARAEEGIAAAVDTFDARPLELCVRNGVVDLATGELGPHDPGGMHSQMAGCDYDPAADAPLWEQFTRRVLPDADTRAYVQKLLGLSLLGSPLPGATFPFVYGPGGTGKSTLLEPVLAALGDYGRMAPANLLVGKRGEQTYDVASLRGKRFVLASEGHSRQTLAEDVVKRITGDLTLAGRQIREAEITFPNTTALWFMSNHEPRVNFADTGLWRRIKEIPMDVELGAEDAGLKERLIEEELPGILAWCVRGCVAAQADGLQVPDEVADATARYQDESNPLLDWVEARCCRDPEAQETCLDLHASYVDWAAATRRRNDYPSVRSKTWARALRTAGAEPVRSSSGRGYQGLRLQQPPL